MLIFAFFGAFQAPSTDKSAENHTVFIVEHRGLSRSDGSDGLIRNYARPVFGKDHVAEHGRSRISYLNGKPCPFSYGIFPLLEHSVGYVKAICEQIRLVTQGDGIGIRVYRRNEYVLSK